MARRSGLDDAAALHTAALELRGTANLQPVPLQTNPPAAQTAVALVVSPGPGILPGEPRSTTTSTPISKTNFNNPTGRVNDLRAYDVS